MYKFQSCKRNLRHGNPHVEELLQAAPVTSVSLVEEMVSLTTSNLLVYGLFLANSIFVLIFFCSTTAAIAQPTSAVFLLRGMWSVQWSALQIDEWGFVLWFCNGSSSAKGFSANQLEGSAHSVVETTNLQAHQKRALRQEALNYPHDAADAPCRPNFCTQRED